MIDYLIAIDKQLFLFLNGLHSPFWDAVMVFVSGKLTWLPLYLVIVFFMFKKAGKEAFWWLLGIAFVVLMADQVSVHAFKYVFLRLRPCHDPSISNAVHLVNGCGGKYGFVSSHAANTFGVAVFLSLLFSKKWVTFSILFWAAFVSYSRIYLGVHFPGDVLVGAILGAGIGIAIWKIASALIFRYARHQK